MVEEFREVRSADVHRDMEEEPRGRIRVGEPQTIEDLTGGRISKIPRGAWERQLSEEEARTPPQGEGAPREVETRSPREYVERPKSLDDRLDVRPGMGPREETYAPSREPSAVPGRDVEARQEGSATAGDADADEVTPMDGKPRRRSE